MADWTAEPVNGIQATMWHGEGAYAQCGECRRYTLDPQALGNRPPTCDCGSKHGWSGSFKKPGPDAKWSGREPAPSAAASGQAAVQEVQPVAWMHEFTDPHDGQRRCEPRRNKPADYELLPGDTVRPLVYAAASQPSAQTDDALEVLRELVEMKDAHTLPATREEIAELWDRARKLVNGGAA